MVIEPPRSYKEYLELCKTYGWVREVRKEQPLPIEEIVGKDFYNRIIDAESRAGLKGMLLGLPGLAITGGSALLYFINHSDLYPIGIATGLVMYMLGLGYGAHLFPRKVRERLAKELPPEKARALLYYRKKF